MKVKLLYGNAIAFFVFGLVALRLHVTGNPHTGNIFMLLSGTCFIALAGLSLSAVRWKRISPIVECLIYYLISLACFWAGGLFGL